MAHKTLVGGTAYETKGGKCMVGGTGYSLKKGRTLVSGTGYDVIFGSASIPVTITGTGKSSRCSAEIDGTEYIAATSGIEVVPGDVITFTIYSTGFGAGMLKVATGVAALNGVYETIDSTSKGKKTYDWTVPECDVIDIKLDYSAISNGIYTGSVTVTAK